MDSSRGSWLFLIPLVLLGVLFLAGRELARQNQDLWIKNQIESRQREFSQRAVEFWKRLRAAAEVLVGPETRLPLTTQPFPPDQLGVYLEIRRLENSDLELARLAASEERKSQRGTIALARARLALAEGDLPRAERHLVAFEQIGLCYLLPESVPQGVPYLLARLHLARRRGVDEGLIERKILTLLLSLLLEKQEEPFRRARAMVHPVLSLRFQNLQNEANLLKSLLEGPGGSQALLGEDFIFQEQGTLRRLAIRRTENQILFLADQDQIFQLVSPGPSTPQAGQGFHLAGGFSLLPRKTSLAAVPPVALFSAWRLALTALVLAVVFLGYGFVQSRRVLEETTKREAAFQYLSHELKTPLSSVILFTENLLRMDPPQEKRREALEKILEKSLALKEMIENLLDLARLRQGTFFGEGRLEKIQPIGLIRHLLAGEAVPGTIQIQDETAGGSLLFPRLAFERIAVNLLKNSYQAAGPGVTVRVSLNENERGWSLAFTDNGPGVDPALLPRLVERFFSTRNSTGLGLALVAEMMEKCRGGLDITNDQGGGLTVTLWIPK